MIWLLSMLASTRSSADHALLVGDRLDDLGHHLAESAPSCTVGKLDSVICKLEKLDEPLRDDTFVSASIFRLPSAGFVAPFAS